jgi:hypothetical protein
MGDHQTANELNLEPNHSGPIGGRSKKFAFEDFSIIGGNGKPLTRFSNVAVLLIHLDNGSVVLNFSAVTTDQGWRGDVFLTAFLQNGGNSIAQYPLPVVHAFCGTQNVFSQANIDSGYFDATDSLSLNANGPNWIRC